MQKPLRKKIYRWLAIVALLYVLGGIAFYFLQERFLFHPEKLPADHTFQFAAPFKEINLAINENKNLNIVQFTVPDSVCRGVVLYFHGNRKNIERYAPFAANFTRHQLEVWMIDYPGFGKSTGDRTEAIMYADAIEVYKMAAARFPRDSIIIYGKSLGTGVAAKLASMRDCKRLILETPYYSIDALLQHYAFLYPVSLLTTFHFPNGDYVQRIHAPITILHGSADEVVPFKQSLRLQKANPEIEVVRIEKGKHNNLNDFPLFHQKLDSLLR